MLLDYGAMRIPLALRVGPSYKKKLCRCPQSSRRSLTQLVVSQALVVDMNMAKIDLEAVIGDLRGEMVVEYNC